MPVVGSSEGNIGGFMKKGDVPERPDGPAVQETKKKGNRTKELSEIKI
jgi:hypothetical protein